MNTFPLREACVSREWAHNTEMQLDFDETTVKWVSAFCLENNISVRFLLQRFMESIADHSGNRQGSWESASVDSFVVSHGLKSCGFEQSELPELTPDLMGRLLEKMG